MNEFTSTGSIKPAVQYTGDGVSTTFAYPFPLFGAEDMEVYLDGVPQTSGFVVNGVGASTGGAVIFQAAIASGVTVTLRRHLPVRRDIHTLDPGESPMERVDADLDYQAAVLEQVEYELDRAVRLSPADADVDLTLPAAAVRSNKILGFDDAGALVVKDGGDVYEPAFDKNTAFNKDFGTTAGTVCEGNDRRLPPLPSGRPTDYLDGTGNWNTLPEDSFGVVSGQPGQLLFRGMNGAEGITGSSVDEGGNLNLGADFTVAGDHRVKLREPFSLLGRFAVARDPKFIHHQGGDVNVPYAAPRVRLVLHADVNNINAPEPVSNEMAVVEQIIEIEQAEGPWSIGSWTGGSSPYVIEGAGPPQLAEEGITEVLTFFDNGVWHVVGTFEASKLPEAIKLSGRDILTGVFASGRQYRTTVAALKRPIVTVASNSRTLTAADVWKYLRCTSESPTTIIVNGGVFAAGDEITLRQAGGGTVSLEGTAIANGSIQFEKHKVAVLKFIDADIYDLIPGV